MESQLSSPCTFSTPRRRPTTPSVESSPTRLVITGFMLWGMLRSRVCLPVSYACTMARSVVTRMSDQPFVDPRMALTKG